MEFGEKIQKLRNQNKWTQEQLAEKLYVSRTAVSKWESGKGYPNIDSLKDIAKLFNKTIDELLSSEEIIDIAKEENTSNIKRTNNLIYGLLDIISILFIFLPLYAQKKEEYVYSVPLMSTNDVSIIESFSVLFFAISRQTYLTAIIFIILTIKIIVAIKNISNKKDVL